MKRQLWVGVLGMVSLLVGCSNSSDGNPAQSSAAPAIAPTSVQQTPSQKAFANSALAQPSHSGRVPAIPGLLQPTNAKARLPGIQTGRLDAFAIVPASGRAVIATGQLNPPKVNASQPVSVSAQGGTVLPGRAPTVAMVPMAPLPNLPAVPFGASGPLPPLIVPSAPSGAAAIASPTSLAEAIAVNGVVQVAGRWSVIVKEPNASSSRYVSVGDYLENGKVLVKKIMSAGSSEPMVILQQNGVEIRKSLG